MSLVLWSVALAGAWLGFCLGGRVLLAGPLPGEDRRRARPPARAREGWGIDPTVPLPDPALTAHVRALAEASRSSGIEGREFVRRLSDFPPAPPPPSRRLVRRLHVFHLHTGGDRGRS